MAEIAFGKVVDAAFKNKVISIARSLQCDPSHLMAAMAFETGERFTASVRNKASGATGLIQFMPATAKSMGTTVEDLAALTPVQQLSYVRRYLYPYVGRLRTVSDVYMAILWPAAVGKPEAHVLFAQGKKAYEQNKGLDKNRDGAVTKGEAAAKVHAMLVKGLSPAKRG
jgi:hypothetical protein